MEYKLEDKLSMLRANGLRQADEMRTGLQSMLALLDEHPGIPFVGCAFCDPWHATDGSVGPVYARLERAVLGVEGFSKHVLLFDAEAEEAVMRNVIERTMELTPEEECMLDDRDTVRDWYTNRIPWTDVVFCVFDSI